jgi:hypothetical protein
MNSPARPVARGHATAILILSLGSLLAVSPAATAGGEGHAVLVPGMRVRIEAPGLAAREGTGTINSVGDTSILLDVPGRAEPVSVTRAEITRLQVSSSRGSRLAHALVGAAIGAIGGVIVANHDGGQYHFPGTTAAVGVAAALVGAGIGSAFPAGEHWRDLPAARYRVALVPSGGSGLGLAVSRAF